MVKAFTGMTFVGGKSDEMITRGLGAAPDDVTATPTRRSIAANALRKLVTFIFLLSNFVCFAGGGSAELRGIVVTDAFLFNFYPYPLIPI